MDKDTEKFRCRYVIKNGNQDWRGGYAEILLRDLQTHIDKNYPNGGDGFVIGCQVAPDRTVELAKKEDGEWITIQNECAILPWSLANREELTTLRELILECTTINHSSGIIERLQKIDKLANDLYYPEGFGRNKETFFQKLVDLATGKSATTLM